MEKYAKRLQDIINEQDFCFEPEEIRTVEKALGVLKKYEDADIPAEACVEYRKFEDELIHDGMSLQHVLDLLKAEREGRLKVRPESLGQCCGQCHHFLSRAKALEDFESCNAEKSELDTSTGENASAAPARRRRCGYGAGAVGR